MKNKIHMVITGHVDHGKSTLIGRLLYDTGSLPKAKIKEIEQISKELGKEAELAFLTDQLKEEREKNITIDTAQINFSHKGQDYIIIDAPGHVEFTRNMLTGAAEANVALLVIDAETGLEEQTLRHLYLLDFIGISQIIVVINKMDRVSYSEDQFEKVCGQFKERAASLTSKISQYVPISAGNGEGIVSKSKMMPWAKEPLIKALANLSREKDDKNRPFAMCIQDEYEIDNKTISVGMIAEGVLNSGQEVRLLPDNTLIKVNRILEFESNLKKAQAKTNIGLIANQRLKRGQVLIDKDSNAKAVNEITANIFWLSEDAISVEQPITLRLDSQEVEANVSHIEKLMDTSTFEDLENKDSIKQNQAARVKLKLGEPIYACAFEQSYHFGRFVIEKGLSIEGAGIVC